MIEMPKNKKNNKEYFGSFYGMRIENDRDKEIRNIIKDISKKKKISENQLIFDYLEKGLNLNANKTINFNQDVLYDNLNLFMKNAYNKISNLEYQLFAKNYEKKISLETFLYNKYPEELQRKQFYLNLIKNQIECELTLLETFFSLIDIKTHEFIGYFAYLCEKENLKTNSENFSICLKKLESELISKWYYKLKTANVIRTMEDFYNIDFNYSALEDFVLELYKGKKLRYSDKEERIKRIAESYSEKKEKKPSKERGLSYLFNTLFEQLIEGAFQLPNFDLNFDQDKYQLFLKIEYKPQIFYDVDIDLDGYLNYIKNNKLKPMLSDCFFKKILFYSFLNDYYLLPPSDLIIGIKHFISYYDNLDKFIKELPSQLKNHHYLLNEVEKIAVYLYKITKESLPLWDQLIKEISFEDLKTKFSIKPNNYDIVFNSIKTDLMKYGINLDKVIKNAEEETVNKFAKRDEFIFNSFPEDIKNKVSKNLLDSEKKIKKKDL